MGQRAFTRFQNSSTGPASRYNKKIVLLIFRSVNRILDENKGNAMSIETIYPMVDEALKNSHIAVLKNDLAGIIIEILDFFVQEGDVDIFDAFFDDVETELKKALWPTVSRLNDPFILELLIEEIYNELDSKLNFTIVDLAEKLSENEMFKNLSFNELLEISEKALLKLEKMHFLVE